MIPESTIERVLDRLESGAEDFERGISAFADEQPHLVAFVTNEENAAFTEEEHRLLLFGALTIYRSVTEQEGAPAQVTPQSIEAAEEANYARMNEATGNFRKKLDGFFGDTEQEDLLAFVEDLISAEADEEAITKEAREPLFITLKTVVDVLT